MRVFLGPQVRYVTSQFHVSFFTKIPLGTGGATEFVMKTTADLLREKHELKSGLNVRTEGGKLWIWKYVY